jgi:4-diphosphocytidyl-2-C-methyl-D-erythritol kinase
VHREAAARLRAPAKLNLDLRVLAREASGFHQIETLFCRLELADDVEVSLRDDVSAADVVSLDVVPGPGGVLPDLGPPRANLAYRAAAAFLEEAGGRGGAHVRLTKRVPAGAGLGGGSSDAAAVLRALNRLRGEPLPEDVLMALGARLGSDVPFLLSGASLALAWGRGGRLCPLPPLPAATVLLAVPAERVPTGEAYAELARSRTASAGEPAAEPRVLTAPADWRAVASEAANDFEDIVFRRLPRAGELRDALEDAGAIVARLTGTGSAVFGVFEQRADTARVESALRRTWPDVTFISTRTA